MDTPTPKSELVEELRKLVRRPEDLFGPTGIFHQLKGALMERLLEEEMSEHLGFEKNAAEGRGAGNTPRGASRARSDAVRVRSE